MSRKSVILMVALGNLFLAKNEIGARLLSIACKAAAEIDSNDVNRVHTLDDMNTDEYRRLHHQLNEIRNKYSSITYAFIQRPTKKTGVVEMIADADSDVFTAGNSIDNEGNMEAFMSYEKVFPGYQYHAKNAYKKAFVGPYLEGISVTRWGLAITAYAPIKDKAGNIVATLGLDMDISQGYRIARKKLR